MMQALAAVLLCAACGLAQIITTVAGTDWIFPPGVINAIGAPLGFVAGVAIDSQGNLFLADPDNEMVFRVSPAGSLSIVAGNGKSGFSGDGGPATQASLDHPLGLATDANGNLYIADSWNSRVRIVTPDGIIRTFAGSGIYAGGVRDGDPATGADLGNPTGLWVDSNGNLLIAVSGGVIYRVSLDGTIFTVAGHGPLEGAGLGDGGPATSAFVQSPQGVTADPAGNLYIADTGNNRVRLATTGGLIFTIAGTGDNSNSGDGRPAVNASLAAPADVRLDGQGNLYIATTGALRVVSGGIIRTVAGGNAEQGLGDGGPAVGALISPQAIAIDATGNLDIADGANHGVRQVTPDGIIKTIAGGGQFRLAGDGGASVAAVLNQPHGLVIDSQQNLYIADTNSSRVREVTRDGRIATIAGNSQAGFGGDGGPATAASLNVPSDLAMDVAGNLFIADTGNNRIREMTPGGIIATVAGTGAASYTGDGGSASAATLSGPAGIVFDSAGNLYIADSGNNVIRKVAPDGTISTFAGSGAAAYSGDGGPASLASMKAPQGLALDTSGNLYIVDGNSVVRRVDKNGTISTVAGDGLEYYSGDGGSARQAELYQPRAIALDRANNLYIADNMSDRVRRVDASGVITTISGNGNTGFGGDGGPAADAVFDRPLGVAFDVQGNLYISDSGNGRIREIPARPLNFSAGPSALSFSATAGSTIIPPPQTLQISSTANLSFSASPLTLAGGNWLAVDAQAGKMPGTLQVSADPTGLGPGSYTGLITVVAPDAATVAQIVAVTLSMQAGTGSATGLALEPGSTTFSVLPGAATQSTTVKVGSAAAAVSFTASAATSNGGNWLGVSPPSGTASPVAPATITVTVQPAGMSPGTYQGNIVLYAAGTSTALPVTLTISSSGNGILVSQTSLSFTAVAQSGAPHPQVIGILNSGTGAMPWTAAVPSPPVGAAWLHISAAQGVVNRPMLDVSPLTVQVDPTGLAPGDYYGQVQIAAAAANSPQPVTVHLVVLPPGSSSGQQVYPDSLIFTGVVGSSPGSQDVAVSVLQNDQFLSGSVGTGFTYAPVSAAIQPGQPATVRVFPDFGSLNAGEIARGTITLQFLDGSSRIIRVLCVAAPPPAAAGLR
jgi:sugar lactone lactonase YvrE